MPKFTYSAAKGIEQSSGSGFQVNDVAILEEVQALSDPSGDAINPYGITTISDTGASAAALAAPTSSEPAGVKKVITKIVDGGTFTLTFTGGGIRVDGSTASNTVTFDAVGETLVCISNGDKWVTVALAGATEAT